MRAVMLAAGVGNRLGDLGNRPKSLLTFGGRSLLQRHLDNLAAIEIAGLTLCTGYEAAQIEAHVQGAPLPVQCVLNPEFRRGSVRSLWTVREAMTCGDDVLLMDADVLYAPALLTRLVTSTHANCFLLDEDFTPGDEPVKICVREGEIVEFRKKPDPSIAFDFCGESVGFFKFSSACAQALMQHCKHYIDAGRMDEPYEEVLRDLILARSHALGFELTRRLPWLEIDFPEDLIRARDRILPLMEASND
ncbi:MAG: phosphocholine cytidylyltransferase family protein [Gammaproteobacteria bacterium]|nr:phosphocholine cytidylyltransferase family protein [Gammaproteobacteria bacterium]